MLLNFKGGYTKLCNEPQQLHSEPQLGLKIDKALKNLQRLVHAFSPLNPIIAGILMKIVLMLVP